jgi:hypothetical protein
MAQSSTFEPLYGLLWWRDATVKSVGLTDDVIAQWRGAGLPETTATKLQPLVGKKFANDKALITEIRSALSRDELSALNDILTKGDHVPLDRNLEIGPVSSIYASGWLGQYLVIVPDKNLVAVRMRRAREADYDMTKKEVDGFRSFPVDVATIVR